MVIDLGPPYNWCDRRCERCPLSDRCAVTLRERERREAARRRGDDPDDPEVVARDITADLEQAMEMLVQAADEDGIDIDELDLDAPLPPESPAQRSLAQRGMAFAVAARELLQGHADEAVREARQCAFLIAGKTGRISMYVTPQWQLDEERLALTCDAMPNIILVEHLLGVVAEGLAVLGERADPGALVRFEEARAELATALLPLSAAVDDEVREALRDLAAAGRAPSPYI